jgi:hypothetical protein
MPQHGQGVGQLLQASVVLVYEEQWRRSMGVVGEGWRPSLAPCMVHAIFRGKAATTVQLYAGTAELVAPLLG